MAKVLELVTTGATILDTVDLHIYNGMLYIIDSFQINIKLEEIWSIVPTTKLKTQRACTISKTQISRSATDDESISASFDFSSKYERKKSYR